METCRDFLAAIKARHALTSDYKLSLALGLSRASVSLLQHGKTTFDDRTALRVAALLGIEPGRVLLAAHIERASDPKVRQAWRALAQRAVTASLVAAAMLGAALPRDASAAILSNPQPHKADAVYYVKSDDETKPRRQACEKSRGRRLLRAIQRLLTFPKVPFSFLT